MFNVRLAMTPAFLYFEYNRPDFPSDFYGFTRDDRLKYAPHALEYLFNDADITYLGDLTFEDGTSLFNTRELRHMRDVKVLTHFAFGISITAGILAFLAGLWLLSTPLARNRLYLALLRGSLLTIALIFSIVLVAVISWDVFFTGFHTVFFEADTWYFAYSDTLIRLFPEQFWFDASLFVGMLSVIQASMIIILSGWLQKRSTSNTL
jgi:integral membrane protein (TIGR01906 family)